MVYLACSRPTSSSA